MPITYILTNPIMIRILQLFGLSAHFRPGLEEDFFVVRSVGEFEGGHVHVGVELEVGGEQGVEGGEGVVDSAG